MSRKTPASEMRISFWEEHGCHFQRFDLGPDNPVELNKIFHDDIVILAVQGSSWYSQQNGHSYIETPGSVVIRDAGQVFSVKTTHIDQINGAVCREIHLSPKRLQQFYNTIDNAFPAIDFHNPVLHCEQLYTLLINTHSICEHSDCQLEKSSYLTALIGALAQKSSRKPIATADKKDNRRLDRVIGYLRDNFDQSITLQDLASVAEANPFVLLRQFRREIGVTPHDYLQIYRINRAKDFIQRGIKLIDVAQLCGFSDQSHLNRQFKRRTGITPGQFIQK
jgi:AraC-like DNA-binding protein